MGAGSKEDHYIQDAAEAYIVWLLQKLAQKHNVAFTNDAEDKKKIFNIYCYERGIESIFNESLYKQNVDTVIDDLFLNLIKKYPNKKFDFIDVEKEFRDKKLKGDFIMQFEDGSYISFSLKNYKKGFGSIQLCSGTWHSFLNNFLFKPVGVGTFKDPFTGQVFQGCNYEYRDNLIDRLGLSSLKDVYNFFDYVNETIKSYYVYGDEAKHWDNISSKWDQDCENYGLEAVDKVISALNGIDNNKIKERIIKMAGLNYDEELLLIGKGKYVCSLLNDRYGEILKRVNSDKCEVEYGKNEKSVLFTLKDIDGIIISIKVPFTLQANGAWYRDSEYIEYHKKEKMSLVWGQRRPKKSKELNTSTNTYLPLKKAGVYAI